MKDQTKLFESISDENYKKQFERLQEMRAKHPGYRDDQLLMWLLCTECETNQ